MAWKDTLHAFIEETDGTYVLAGAALIVMLLLVVQSAGGPVLTGNHQISVLVSVDGAQTSTHQLVVANNTTAFDALNKAYNVTYQKSTYGYFITGINGVMMNDTHSWIYLVNGKPPSKAVNTYVLADRDNVTFWFMSNHDAKQYFQ